jgi:hypothetical protein
MAKWAPFTHLITKAILVPKRSQPGTIGKEEAFAVEEHDDREVKIFATLLSIAVHTHSTQTHPGHPISRLHSMTCTAIREAGMRGSGWWLDALSTTAGVGTRALDHSA